MLYIAEMTDLHPYGDIVTLAICSARNSYSRLDRPLLEYAQQPDIHSSRKCEWFTIAPLIYVVYASDYERVEMRDILARPTAKNRYVDEIRNRYVTILEEKRHMSNPERWINSNSK